MSILIKGMERPNKKNGAVLIIYPDGKCVFEDGKTYQAVPAPEPHGRLIDADALMLKIREYIDEYGELDENGFHSEKWCAMKEAEMAACETPTVIPASESKERPAFLPQYELTPRSKEG